jgi:hypothetical protein
MADQETRIEHHKTYFIDAPRKGGRSNFEVILLYREIINRPRYRRVNTSANSWQGDTLDEAERQMVEWIGRVGAVEVDIDLKASN